MTIRNLFFKPLLLANTFVFGLAITDARHVLLSGEDPSKTTPIAVALAMRAMGASYKDTVGVNPKSMAHAFTYLGTAYGDAIGKIGTIAFMKGYSELTADMVNDTFPNKYDLEKRQQAQLGCLSQNFPLQSHKQG